MCNINIVFTWTPHCDSWWRTVWESCRYSSSWWQVLASVFMVVRHQHKRTWPTHTPTNQHCQSMTHTVRPEQFQPPSLICCRTHSWQTHCQKCETKLLEADCTYMMMCIDPNLAALLSQWSLTLMLVLASWRLACPWHALVCGGMCYGCS